MRISVLPPRGRAQATTRFEIRAFCAGGAAPVLLAALTLGTVSEALAAGFQINEQSAPNTGRASSVVATVGDASAIFHNPAGLTRIQGTEFQVGTNVIVPTAEYVGVGIVGSNPGGGIVSEDLDSDPVPVPYVYAGRQLSEKAFVGLGFYLPYGSSFAWEDETTFVGRTQNQEISLRSFFFTPTVALKLNEMVSVAVGVSLVPATLLLRRELGATDNEQPLFSPTPGTLEGSATAFGVGATAGVQVSLIDHLRLGFVFKSAVVSGEITVPHTFGLGVGWEQGPWTVELGGQLTLWESYDELRINFDSGLPTPSTASPRNWEVVPMIRVGAEYRLENAAFRLGGGYDVSPIPDDTADFTLADNDRIFFSLGAGYDFGTIRADFAYMALLLAERELEEGESVNIPNGGTFTSDFGHVFSLSIGVEI